MFVFICLGLWLYFQAKGSETPDALQTTASAYQKETAPTQTPVEIMTPAQLYQQYSANEVATDQAIAGKIIQITAPVKSIDKDFTNSAVLQFATGNEFGEMGVTLDDSQKAQAAKLSQGQVVTVQCKTMRRILESPMGSDCVFTDAAPAAQAPTLDSAPKADELFRKMDRVANNSAADEYAAAIQRAITPNWVRPANLPQAPCEVHITQLPGGDVVSAIADDGCPYDMAGKIAVENAVLRSQPLPYKGFEGVFQRNITVTFRPQ